MRLAELRAATGVADAAPHAAAQCLRLVRAARPRHLRAVGRRARGARAVRRSAGGARRPSAAPPPAAPRDGATAPTTSTCAGWSPSISAPARGCACCAPAPAFGASVFVVDFDRGRAALPHPRLVRPVVRRGRPGGAAGHRAVEHGPALPGESGVSLRAADVARLRAVRAAGHRRCCSGSAAPRCGASCAPMCRNARRPWSMPTRRRGDRAALVLSEPAGRHRYRAALSRRQHARGSTSSWSISTIRTARRRSTRTSGRAASTRWRRAGVSRPTGPISRPTRRCGRWPRRRARWRARRGLDTYYVTRRGFRDNLIQYLPTGAERRPEAITGALERFAREPAPARPRPRHPRTLPDLDRLPDRHLNGRRALPESGPPTAQRPARPVAAHGFPIWCHHPLCVRSRRRSASAAGAPSSFPPHRRRPADSRRHRRRRSSA